MERIACALTGHRPKKLPWREDEEDEGCQKLKRALETQLRKLVKAGATDFLTGMAEGVDTWGAEIVLALRMDDPALKLHCILPCVDQAKKWKATAQEQYRAILEQADSIVYVSREKSKNCMLERDRFLVAHADLLLAVYNGEPRGGTAATVRYAGKRGLDVWIIDPNTRRTRQKKPRPL